MYLRFLTLDLRGNYPPNKDQWLPSQGLVLTSPFQSIANTVSISFHQSERLEVRLYFLDPFGFVNLALVCTPWQSTPAILYNSVPAPSPFFTSLQWFPVSVSIAALKKYYKCNSFKFLVLHFWMPEFQNQFHWTKIKVSTGLVSFWRLWGN